MNAVNSKSNEAPEVNRGGPLAAVIAAVALLACCLGLPILLGVASGGGIALFAADSSGSLGAVAAGMIGVLGVGFVIHKMRRRGGVVGGRGS